MLRVGVCGRMYVRCVRMPLGVYIYVEMSFSIIDSETVRLKDKQAEVQSYIAPGDWRGQETFQ